MIQVPGSNSSASWSTGCPYNSDLLAFSASMGTPRYHKSTLGGPTARAGWVVGPGCLYPFDSQYYTQHYCQKQFALILPVEKVKINAKVVRGLEGGVDRTYSHVPRSNLFSPVYGVWGSGIWV